jgi:hypothetical protein
MTMFHSSRRARVLIWALLPLLVLGGAFFVFADSGIHRPSSLHFTEPIVEPQGELSLRLIFTGDIMGHSPQIEAAYDSSQKAHDYRDCFRYVKKVLSAPDIAVGNLEVTLPGKGPYSGYPMFKSPDALAVALKEAGLDLMVTANNHSNDGKLIGVTHTIDVLRELGFQQTGTFKDAADRNARYPLIWKFEKEGRYVKLAVLNFTYGTNGIPDHAPSMVNLIDTAQIRKDVARAKSYSPDFVLAVVHWGAEYQLDESAEQRKTAQFLADLGVQLIVGMHPHVVQPVKTLKAKNGETLVCAYSLGNFISNQKQANTDLGLMFEVELSKDLDNGKTRVSDYAWIPVWRWIGPKRPKYFVLPVSAVESDTANVLGIPQTARTAMSAVAGRIRAHLGKHAGKERKLTVADVR